MKRVSIAMAVYNGELFLRAQLDSIIEQLNYCDELIISYDSSTDRTWEIIKEYEARYSMVKVFRNSDKGVFGNFENAIKRCTGDIIFISDQDDIWLSNKIRTVCECFEKTSADMVIHNGKHINSKGEIISASFFDMYNIKKGKVRNFLKPRYSGCCTAFTKEIRERIIPIPRCVGAYDHWIGMIGELQGELIFLNDCLIYHRLHDENYTPEGRRSLKVIASARINLAYSLFKRRRRAHKR